MSDIGKGDWVEFIGPKTEVGPNGRWTCGLTVGSSYYVEGLKPRIYNYCYRCKGDINLVILGYPKTVSPCLFRPLKKPPSETVKTSSKEPQFETTS
jgi:hypothetical protein